MCTRILKKESSSRALAFVVLLFMMPLGFIGNAQSCGATEDTEHQPLLRRNDVAIPINGDGGDLEEGGLILNGIPQVHVPQNLLIELDSQSAVAAKKDIDQYLYYADLVSAGVDGEEGLEILFQESSERLKISNKQELGEELLKRARAALKANGELITYLRAIKGQANSLREKIKEFKKQEQESHQRELAREREMAAQKEQTRSLEKSLCRTRWILGISLPAVTLLSIGAVLFTHYYWRIT